MGAEWVFLVETNVYTRILTQFSTSKKKSYRMTDDNFSTVGSSDTPPVFPFVYIQLLPSAEIGKTCEVQDRNGGLFTFQIDVTDNQSKGRALDVAKEVDRIMANMGFTAKQFPTADTAEKGTHRAIARYTKAIAENDTL